MPLVIDATDLAFESVAIEGHHSCRIDVPSSGLPRTWDKPAAHVVAVVQRAFGDNNAYLHHIFHEKFVEFVASDAQTCSAIRECATTAIKRLSDKSFLLQISGVSPLNTTDLQRLLTKLGGEIAKIEFTGRRRIEGYGHQALVRLIHRPDWKLPEGATIRYNYRGFEFVARVEALNRAKPELKERIINLEEHSRRTQALHSGGPADGGLHVIKDPTRQREACRDFARGACARQVCRFSHARDQQPEQRDPKQPGQQRDQQQAEQRNQKLCGQQHDQKQSVQQRNQKQAGQQQKQSGQQRDQQQAEAEQRGQKKQSRQQREQKQAGQQQKQSGQQRDQHQFEAVSSTPSSSAGSTASGNAGTSASASVGGSASSSVGSINVSCSAVSSVSSSTASAGSSSASVASSNAATRTPGTALEIELWQSGSGSRRSRQYKRRKQNSPGSEAIVRVPCSPNSPSPSRSPSGSRSPRSPTPTEASCRQ